MMPGKGWGKRLGRKEICLRNGWEESAVSRNEKEWNKNIFGMNGCPAERIGGDFVLFGTMKRKRMRLGQDALD